MRLKFLLLECLTIFIIIKKSVFEMHYKEINLILRCYFNKRVVEHLLSHGIRFYVAFFNDDLCYNNTK